MPNHYPEVSEAERERRRASAAHARAAMARKRAAAKLADAVREVVEGAPRLTAEQVATLRALLPPVRPVVDADDEPQPAA